MAIVKEVEKKITSHQYAYDTIAYVLSPENKHGDEKCFRATCLNCINDGVESLSKQFYVTRKAFNKDDKILSHHYVQSFSPNENVTPELAHQIAVELMKKVAPNYQVIISTHVDKDHIHNHIIINSVSMETGMKWKANWRTRMDMRKESDKLCKQYGLSAIDNKSGLRGIDQATQKLAEKGQSWKVDLCNALDEATQMCITKKDFIDYMKVKGFEITRYTDRHITFRKIGETKKIRADTLAEQFGEIYKKENLEKKMGFYKPSAPIEQTPRKKKVQSPFITEFERFEKDYFSKNPPLAKTTEIKKLHGHIKQSSNPLLTLLLIIFKLLVRRKKKSMLDKKYHKLRRYGATQTTYKKYVPSLAEQVKRIERLQRTAGNIPYQRLISSQGENYRVKVTSPAVSKLYAYGFFFSARLFNDGALVTVKERDKYILQQALGVEDIKVLEQHNRHFKQNSDYADLKKRAEQIGSKIEYLMIELEQLELLKNETDRFVKFNVDGKIRLAFLEENKKFILRKLYPDKYKSDSLFSVSRNSKVNTRLKAEVLLDGQVMRYRRCLTKEQVERIAENTKGEELFAVFNKNAKGESLGEDTYNIAYKSGDEEKIENALKSNTNTDTKPKRRR